MSADLAEHPSDAEATVYEQDRLLREVARRCGWLKDLHAANDEDEVFDLIDEHLLDTLRFLYAADYKNGPENADCTRAW